MIKPEIYYRKLCYYVLGIEKRNGMNKQFKFRVITTCSGLMLLFTACQSSLTHPSPSTTSTLSITKFDSSSYITATSIQELANRSTIIVLGKAVERGDVINLARDVNDSSKPDHNLFGIGQVYVFKVEKYIKGDKPANETDLIYVVQPEGMIVITPEAPLSKADVEKAHQQDNYIPFYPDTEYLLFLEPLRGFQDLKYHYVGVAQPWGFNVSDPEKVITESPWFGASRFFQPEALKDIIAKIENPEGFTDQPYPGFAPVYTPYP